MNREDLLREITRIDSEINKVVVETELPSVRYQPFPKIGWILAGALALWAIFGQAVPHAEAQTIHAQYSVYGLYGAAIFGLLALLRTITFFTSRSSMLTKSARYRENSAKIRELQEQRRQLQSELNSISD